MLQQPNHLHTREKTLPKKKSRRRFFRFSVREAFLLFAGFCIPFAIYVFYLDYHVREKFEGRRFSMPARVFARPLELYEGKKISADQLSRELIFLKYDRVGETSKPGDYSRSGAHFSIFTRSFTFWDGKQDTQHISISLKNGVIDELKEHDTGEIRNLVRLDPIIIGGIYPKQGEDRNLVRLNQVPNSLIESLIAVEDKRFYQHIGVDPKAVVRAIKSMFSGGRVQGGSTITQQLIKNFYLTQERTLSRKLKEMIMALLLEAHYEKDDILETYINEVYFGQDKNRAIHGFGLASQFYFSQPIENLNLQQSALLVGLLKGPAYYNPRRHADRAKARRDIVLWALRNQGKITDEEYQSALFSPVSTSKKPNIGQTRYPAFMELAIKQLKRDYRESDLRNEGLRIFTTVDPYEQNIAENALQNNLKKMESQYRLPKGHLQGAIVLVNVLDGEVKAVVGGRDPNYPGFNRALDASRQIGSLIKPAIYLTALEDSESFNLNTELDDEEFIWSEPGIEDWRPLNYDKQFHGKVPLWLALAKSYNVAAARLGTELGVENIMNTTRRLGINKKLPNYASGMLGTVHLTPYEVTQMYHTIASGGFKTPFRAIREVTTMAGEPLKRYSLDIEQAVANTPNYLLTRALQEVVRQGTAKGLDRHIDKSLGAAGKTGTTDNLRDSWFAGFTGNNIAVVWVGNDDNNSIGLTGSSGALNIWGNMIKRIDNEPLEMAKPEEIKLVPIDRKTGLIATNNCDNTFLLPFAIESLPEDGKYCGGKSQSKITSWIKKIFTKK